MGKILAVTSVIPGNGSKYVATHVAKMMVNEDNHKVLLVDYDFAYPFLGFGLKEEEEGEKGLDSLLAISPHGEIQDEIFLSHLQETASGFSLLSGTQLIGKFSHVRPEQLTGILRKAKELFDRVIVVVPPKADNPATPYVLSEADDALLVVRQNHSNKGLLPLSLKTLEHFYLKNTAWVLYNYYTGHPDATFNELLGDTKIQLQVAGAIAFDPKSVDHSDFGKRSGLLSKSINEKEWKSIYANITKEEL